MLRSGPHLRLFFLGLAWPHSSKMACCRLSIVVSRLKEKRFDPFLYPKGRSASSVGLIRKSSDPGRARQRVVASALRSDRDSGPEVFPPPKHCRRGREGTMRTATFAGKWAPQRGARAEPHSQTCTHAAGDEAPRPPSPIVIVAGEIVRKARWRCHLHYPAEAIVPQKS